MKKDVVIIGIIILLVVCGNVFYKPVDSGDELITFNTTYKIFNR